MDHSVWGYLSRRSSEELKKALHSYMEQNDDFYQDIILMIYEILENRKAGSIDER